MLLFLLVLFSLPVLAVIAMYALDYRPGGSSHGELLTPPKPLHLIPTRSMQGTAVDETLWKKKWHLVVVAEGTCEADCLGRVHLVRQIHVTLNKEIERAERVLIIANATDSPALAQLQQQYPDLIVLVANEANLLASEFDLAGQPARSSGRVYIVDPLGNLIMSYPAGFDPKGMQQDLTKLLKYSWVG